MTTKLKTKAQSTIVQKFIMKVHDNYSEERMQQKPQQLTTVPRTEYILNQHQKTQNKVHTRNKSNVITIDYILAYKAKTQKHQVIQIIYIVLRLQTVVD